MGGAGLGYGGCLLDGSCSRVGPRANRCLKRLEAGPARAQPVTSPPPAPTSQVTLESRGAGGSLDDLDLSSQSHGLAHACGSLGASKIQVFVVTLG